MKDQIYNDMCSFLTGKEKLLNDFMNFHEENKDSENYLEIFESEFGAMYKSFKESPLTSIPRKTIQPAPNPKAEKILKIVALTMLISGIIGTIVLITTIGFVDVGNKSNYSNEYGYTEHYEFSFIGFIISLGPVLFGVMSWAVLNVLRNISLNLFEIKNKE